MSRIEVGDFVFLRNGMYAQVMFDDQGYLTVRYIDVDVNWVGVDVNQVLKCYQTFNGMRPLECFTPSTPSTISK